MSDPLFGAKIIYAKLHGGDTFIPGYGSFGNTLPSQSKSVKMDMEHAEKGVYIVLDGGKARTLVPWANVQIVTYSNEPARPKVSLVSTKEKAANA